MKKALALLIGVIMLALPVSAQTYSVVYPAWVPVSGGAWVEADTAQGQICVVVPLDYRIGYFGFSGSGYNVANLTSTSISGTAYAQGNFTYYGNPSSVQCRFTRMSTLEVYAPYQNNYGGTSYQWETLDITAIHNTNMDFVDEVGDRQNDAYRYDTTQKILILLFCLVVLLGVFMIFRKAWKA